MSTFQALPRSAEAYTVAQRREIGAAVSAALRVWGRMGSEFDASWSVIGPEVLAVTYTAQERVTAGALEYIPAVLEDTGQPNPDPVARVRPASLVGVAGDGREVSSLLYGAVTEAKSAVAVGGSVSEALGSGRQFLSTALGTLLSDTGRAGERLGMGVRPRVGAYVRMLVPPSCSRCVILAGKWFSRGAAFQRHPRCDCRHIPASEAVADDLTVDPYEYFESLTAEQQGATFGQAGAEAIRSGADMNQVVNARRGLRAAQIGGRDVLLTSEGITRRGWAYSRLRPAGTVAQRGELVTRVTRTGPEVRRVTREVARRPRLMPETISRVARDRDDYLRLLRANGYIL